MVNRYHAVGFASGVAGSLLVTPLGTLLIGGGMAMLGERKTKDFGYGLLAGSGTLIAAGVVLVLFMVAAPPPTTTPAQIGGYQLLPNVR